MNFPRWIRSEVSVTVPAELTDDEIRNNIIDALVNSGATDIKVAEDAVRFRAERAILNTNPLSPCREGYFVVMRSNKMVHISYGLDFIYFLIGACCFSTIFFLVLLDAALHGQPLVLLFPALFLFILFPLSYLFYFYKVRSLFNDAPLLEEPD